MTEAEYYKELDKADAREMRLERMDTPEMWAKFLEEKVFCDKDSLNEAIAYSTPTAWSLSLAVLFKVANGEPKDLAVANYHEALSKELKGPMAAQYQEWLEGRLCTC